MRICLIGFVVILTNAMPSYAIKITAFADTTSFVERSRDIVIGRCLAAFPAEGAGADGLYPADVEVIQVLKGTSKLGKARIATIYEMRPGRTYLLSSLGGSAYQTDFLAVPELSVVQFPKDFNLPSLQGKSVRDQVQAIFDARRAEVQQRLRRLQQEKVLLDKAAGK